MTGKPPELDMAVLASCNHSIITLGSFGFWTGFLTGGEVVYPDVRFRRSYRYSETLPGTLCTLGFTLSHKKCLRAQTTLCRISDGFTLIFLLFLVDLQVCIDPLTLSYKTYMRKMTSSCQLLW